MKVAGIDDTNPFFTFREICVIYSRVTSEKNLYINAPNQKTHKIHSDPKENTITQSGLSVSVRWCVFPTNVARRSNNTTSTAL